MTIAKGLYLGPYEIHTRLGAGGMGEVWRARDHRIRRDVAVKVLTSQTFGAADDRLQRFEQEARAAGSLNHPGLVTLFDVGRTDDGIPYIVMELLEGQTLRELIGDVQPTPLHVRKALDISIQIASALSVAHSHGIIHRDLKPENIFITTDRLVKILDFGLAKLAPDSRETEQDRDKTARHFTSTGMVVGTPGYMSPEQVRAAPLDHRTDIFSFGAVMYEMVTGRRAFDAPSAVETMHAVLSEEPPPIEVDVSQTFEDAIRHCLEKNPRERFESAHDLAFHLKSVPEMQRTLTGRIDLPTMEKPRRVRAAIVALAMLLAAAAGGFVWRGFHNGGSGQPGRMCQQLTSDEGLETFPTLAPDGKSFAYVSARGGNRDIYVQRVDGKTAVNITPDSPDDDSEPVFSPDGAQIAFRSDRDGGGIFVMSVTGESPKRLTNFGHNPSWSPDGTQIAFASEVVELLPSYRPRASELWVVDMRSGVTRKLLEPDAVQPSWSPHGKRIAYWSVSGSGQRDVWTIDPHAPDPSKTAVRATTDTALHWNPAWSPNGKYLYYGSDRDGTLNLWRMLIDESSGKPAGAPELIDLPASFSGDYAFAKTGDLVYVAVASSYRVLAMALDVNAGTIGPAKPVFGGSHEIFGYEVAPDGKSIAYATSGVREDLFVTDGTRIRQLTNDPARDRGVQWAADGRSLYFYSNRDGVYRIWSIRADGSALAPVTTDAEAKSAGMEILHSPVPSPDGSTVLVQGDLAGKPDKRSALVHLDRPPGQRIEVLPVLLASAKWSPDGRFIVGRDQREPDFLRDALSDPPGSILLYSLATRRVETLSTGGYAPHWTPDGKKIVYFERQNVRILDLQSRTVKSVLFAPVGAAQLDLRNNPRLSQDAATLYVRQSNQQGDIWMVHFPG